MNLKEILLLIEFMLYLIKKSFYGRDLIMLFMNRLYEKRKKL